MMPNTPDGFHEHWCWPLELDDRPDEFEPDEGHGCCAEIPPFPFWLKGIGSCHGVVGYQSNEGDPLETSVQKLC